MKSVWRNEIKARAARACDVLQEDYGLKYVTGSLEVRCAKMWEFYSRDRGEGVRPARALAEFAYARALDSSTPVELVRGDEKSPGALARILDVAERLIAITGDAATLGSAGQEAAALAQALRIHAQDVREPDERTRLNKAADVFGRAGSLTVELSSLRRVLPVEGCLLPARRMDIEPEPLLGLQERERARALNRDLLRLERAGVPEAQLAQVWYGEDTPESRKRVHQKLRDTAKAEEK